MVRPLLDSLIDEFTKILKREVGCDKKSTRNTEWCNSYVTEEVLICNWPFLGKKSCFFTGEIKSCVTHITQNPPRHLVHIGFWSGIGHRISADIQVCLSCLLM